MNKQVKAWADWWDSNPDAGDDLGNDPSWTRERCEQLRSDMQRWIAEVKDAAKAARRGDYPEPRISRGES